MSDIVTIKPRGTLDSYEEQNKRLKNILELSSDHPVSFLNKYLDLVVDFLVQLRRINNLQTVQIAGDGDIVVFHINENIYSDFFIRLADILNADIVVHDNTIKLYTSSQMFEFNLNFSDNYNHKKTITAIYEYINGNNTCNNINITGGPFMLDNSRAVVTSDVFSGDFLQLINYISNIAKVSQNLDKRRVYLCPRLMEIKTDGYNKYVSKNKFYSGLKYNYVKDVYTFLYNYSENGTVLLNNTSLDLTKDLGITDTFKFQIFYKGVRITIPFFINNSFLHNTITNEHDKTMEEDCFKGLYDFFGISKSTFLSGEKYKTISLKDKSSIV